MTKIKWKDLEDKLKGFSQLEDGWNSYDASKPSSFAIRSAKLFLEVAQQFDQKPDRIAPSAVGGIGISFHKDGKKAYVEFRNNAYLPERVGGGYAVLFSDGETEPIVKKYGEPSNTEGLFTLVLRDIRNYLNG